jgi:hypothetical protein
MWTRLHLCANPRANAWLLIHPTTPTFCLSPTHFLISLHIHIGLPHPTMVHLLHCRCGHAIDDLGTHLLWCSYGSEHTTTHNTLQDVIATIALESGAHAQKEVFHLFPHHTQWQIDILITKDNFWTFMDIIIANSTHIYMVQQALTTTTHATMMGI